MQTKIKQLDMLQVEVSHNEMLFLTYQASFYANEQEPELSSRYYNDYELDQQIKKVKDCYKLGLYDKVFMDKLVFTLEFAKQQLDTEYADVIEFTEEL